MEFNSGQENTPLNQSLPHNIDIMTTIDEIELRHLLQKKSLQTARQKRYWHRRSSFVPNSILLTQSKKYEYHNRRPPKKPIDLGMIHGMKKKPAKLYLVTPEDQQEKKIAGTESSVTKHCYNDLSPVIKSADNFESLYVPKTVQYIWSANNLDYSVAMKLKADIQKYLDLSLEDQAEHMSRLMSVKFITEEDTLNNACDKELIGQRGVFAKQDIPAMTVLGIYSGIFIRDQAEMVKLARKISLDDLQDYLFRIPIVDKFPKITAFQHGNRLSIVNAASNYQSSDEIIYQEILRRANIMLLTAKTAECSVKEIAEDPECPDTLLFISGRNIPKGEQLLYDYGNVYW